MYLVGDEDCGVGLYCRRCDDENWQGGRPLAYGFGITANPYPEDQTRSVSTLAELIAFAEHHMATHIAKVLAD